MRKSKYAEYYETEKALFIQEQLKKNKKGGIKQALQAMCQYYGLPYNRSVERKYQYMVKGETPEIKNIKLEESDEFKSALKRSYDPKKKRYIITWAQIETPLHSLFWQNLLAYADFLDAGIHVVAGRYKNPNSLESSNNQKNKEKNKSYWPIEVRPYLDANRQQIHPYLSVLSDVKVQPTAVKPLSGIEGFTGLESSILGHPKVHMRSLPVLDGYPNKLMWTTGACTVENYTDTKIGKRGEFNHQIGFVVVEIDDSVGGFHVRQVQAVDSDGSFMDLTYHVHDGMVLNNHNRFPAVVLGDIHLGSENVPILKTSLQLARRLKADHVVLHDIFDGKSINPHEQKDPFKLLEKEMEGLDDLQDELNYMFDFFDSNRDLNLLVVRSNHDDFLCRFLKNTDWRVSPNKKLYWELGSIMADGRAPEGILPYLLNSRYTNVTALGYNSSFRIKDWEVGMHGNLGTNGSRGSLNQFKSLNTKTITGHSHVPGREDGAISVGTLTKRRLGYNQGLSSWFESIVVIYPNGKSQHVNFIKGKFTTLCL